VTATVGARTPNERLSSTMYRACTVSDGLSTGNSLNSAGLFVAFTYNTPVAGSNAPPPHPPPPIAPGITIVPSSDGGVYKGPVRY